MCLLLMDSVIQYVVFPFGIVLRRLLFTLANEHSSLGGHSYSINCYAYK